ncbi:hypothetical protein BJV82DRAFT_556709 [Fennellomyces sp. T-0311]|nr:hypothetical protein BJV82DRAFT_556709 [Fennellomyces sp. T-0311]
MAVLTTLLVGAGAFAIVYRKRGGFYYRSVVCVFCLAVCAFYGVVASLVLPIFGRADLVNWSVARFYYNLLGYLVDIKVEIEGAEHLERDSPAIFCANHQSSMDIFFMASVFPKATAVVAKKALKYYPFLGWYMTLAKNIFVDRKNQKDAIATAKETVKQIHKKNTSVWFFPEGTRGHAEELDLLKFKKGAFYMSVQARVPIIPIVIANYYDLYDSKSKRFKSGVVKIKVLPPVDTSDVQEDSASIDKLSTSVRDDMVKTLREITDRKTQ